MVFYAYVLLQLGFGFDRIMGNLKANLRTIGSRCRLAGTGAELPNQVRCEDGPQRHGHQEDNGPPDQAAREVGILALEGFAKLQPC